MQAAMNRNIKLSRLFLLRDVLHDHHDNHLLLDVLHDHLIKHLLLPILDVLHEL